MELIGEKLARLRRTGRLSNLASPAYASLLYGKGWFRPKLPFLINVYYANCRILPGGGLQGLSPAFSGTNP